MEELVLSFFPLILSGREAKTSEIRSSVNVSSSCEYWADGRQYKFAKLKKNKMKDGAKILDHWQPWAKKSYIFARNFTKC